MHILGLIFCYQVKRITEYSIFIKIISSLLFNFKMTELNLIVVPYQRQLYHLKNHNLVLYLFP